MAELAHVLNIAMHVSAGMAAIVIGLLVLVRPKGTRAHRRWGRRYYLAFALVLGCAVLGLLTFRPDAALAAVTLLTGYLLWSGWRALRLRGARPGPADIALALVAAGSGAALAIRVSLGGTDLWKPQVVTPIAGALAVWGLFDLLRGFAPASWRGRFWRLEHGAKLISSLSGLISAGLGTALAAYKPWSQVGPSVVMTLFLVAYLAAFHRRHAPALRTA